MTGAKMQVELLLYSAILHEQAKESGMIATNKYSGNDLPYRWEIHSGNSQEWLATISLCGSEILELAAMSAGDQRAFLHSSFNFAVEACRAPRL